MSSHSLKIATYNILYDSDITTIWKNIQTLIKSNVDLFCFQEVSQEKLEYLQTEIKKSYGSNWRIELALPDDLFGCAIMWNRKLQLKKLDKIILPEYPQLKLNELIFYILDGIPLHSVRRTCISGLFSYKDKIIQVNGIHLSDAGGKNFRMTQLKTAYKKFSQTESDISILCGDFNSFDFLKTGQEKKKAMEILEGYIDSTQNIDWSADLYNVLYSVRKTFLSFLIKTFSIHLRKRLDYIWVEGARRTMSKRIDLPGSDHMPVVAEVEF